MVSRMVDRLGQGYSPFGYSSSCKATFLVRKHLTPIDQTQLPDKTMIANTVAALSPIAASIPITQSIISAIASAWEWGITSI